MIYSLIYERRTRVLCSPTEKLHKHNQTKWSDLEILVAGGRHGVKICTIEAGADGQMDQFSCFSMVSVWNSFLVKRLPAGQGPSLADISAPC